MRAVLRDVVAPDAHREVDGVDIVEVERDEPDRSVAVPTGVDAGHDEAQVRDEERRGGALCDAGPFQEAGEGHEPMTRSGMRSLRLPSR